MYNSIVAGSAKIVLSQKGFCNKIKLGYTGLMVWKKIAVGNFTH